MSKRKSTKKLPYWQTTPCPAWCMGGHRAGDGVPDRRHLSRWQKERKLSQYSAAVHVAPDHPMYESPVEVEVCVVQDIREVEARVWVTPLNAPELDVLDLTLEEADWLSRQLARAVAIARDER